MYPKRPKSAQRRSSKVGGVWGGGAPPARNAKRCRGDAHIDAPTATQRCPEEVREAATWLPRAARERPEEGPGGARWRLGGHQK